MELIDRIVGISPSPLFIKKTKMSKEEFIKELEEIVSYFKEDGIYALKGLEDKINNLKNQNEDE